MSLPYTPLPVEPHLRPRGPRVPPWTWLALLVGIGVVMFAVMTWAPEAVQGGVILASLPVTAGSVLYLIFRSYRYERANQTARDHLLKRRLAEASAAFEDNAREFPRPVAYAAESIVGLGAAQLLAGDIDRALSLLSSADQFPGAAGWAQVRERIPGWMALAFTAAGREREAAAWLEEGERRCDATSAVLCLLPRALRAARAGHHDEVATLLTRPWTDAEVLLAGPLLPEMRLLRAYALSQQGPPSAGTHAAEITTLLAGAWTPDGSRWLTDRWPALAQLLAHPPVEAAVAAPAPPVSSLPERR